MLLGRNLLLRLLLTVAPWIPPSLLATSPWGRSHSKTTTTCWGISSGAGVEQTLGTCLSASGFPANHVPHITALSPSACCPAMCCRPFRFPPYNSLVDASWDDGRPITLWLAHNFHSCSAGGPIPSAPLDLMLVH